MKLSYDYDDLLDRLIADLDADKLPSDTIYIKRKHIHSYNAIVDYGYDLDEFKRMYGDDFEKSTISDVYGEMYEMNKLI